MSADFQWIKCRYMLYKWPGLLLQTSLLWKVGRGSSKGIFYMCWCRRVSVRKQMTDGQWLNAWDEVPQLGELLVGCFCNKKGRENNGFSLQWAIYTLWSMLKEHYDATIYLLTYLNLYIVTCWCISLLDVIRSLWNRRDL